MKFEFMTANRIIVERGGLKQIGKLTKSFGQRVLLVGRLASDDTKKAIEYLNSENCIVTPVNVKGEPSVDSINEILTVSRKNQCEVVVAIGGGSVLDSGKTIAALMTNTNDIMDYLEVIGNGVPVSKKSLPFIAVPTTSGTGAEATKNATILSATHKVKVSIRSPYMLPDVVLLDPELTVSVPKDVTASTGLDALTQVLEPYVSKMANPMTDAFAKEGLTRASRSLKTAYDHGEDIDAREDMAIASLFGGIALANAKLGAVHGFAGVLGGMYPIPHGVVCARLLPYVTRKNIEVLNTRDAQNPAVNRYEDVAKILTRNPDAKALDGVAWLEELCNHLDVASLSHFGVKEEHFDEIIKKSMNASSMKGNPIELTYDELKDILQQAL
ncbi:MAG: alcohol dehydrogenase [Firmicutes bacterium HGW-Firmicutes-20]|jgi:alcohol dehydrogenase class IV|nr:MAG: alcohol dehydrogenase [Firmicutes bacterium HGW-Firmicutes-20]PKM69667.1 MAG: alcohol dehydrogenase [Firmicutes bacterium HGW-Firmicutes-19]